MGAPFTINTATISTSENQELPVTLMPSTRYQGSKRKVLPRLRAVLEGLKFSTCLDAFGGTGAVSHLLREMGARVCYNDILHSNCANASALFSVGPVRLSEEDISGLFRVQPDVQYLSHIQELYRGIYYTEAENRQLDVVVQNIQRLTPGQGRNEAFYALFQSMLSKRPYNLFHRANLEMRTSDVPRSFGNKATWDRSFETHMKRFLGELRGYRSRQTALAPVCVRNGSAFECDTTFDLVYIDPPYAKSSRSQESNYFNFYHFLDAMVRYDEIPSLIRLAEKHRPIYPPSKPWHPCADVPAAFRLLAERFSGSQIVVSYRDDGFPTIDEIVSILRERFRAVEVYDIAEYRYALAARGRASREVVVVGRP